MAVVVDVLKLTQVEGVVCVRGTAATGTIALATTLKKSTETQSSPTVDIKGLQWALSSGASAKVQRNSVVLWDCLLYTSPSPRDATLSRMPSSA